MKRFIALKLAFILLCSSLSTLGSISTAEAAPAQNQSSCENGECIEKIVNDLEDLSGAFKRQCLPKNVKESQIEAYLEENGLSENCWKILTEINKLEDDLQKHQTRLEQKLGCDSGDCKLPNQSSSLNAQISEITKVEQQYSCTEPKKQAIRNQCPADTACLMVSTALGMGGYIAEMFLPEKAKIKGCHLGMTVVPHNLLQVS